VELSNVHLQHDIWDITGCLSNEEAEALIQPFSMEEIDKVVKCKSGTEYRVKVDTEKADRKLFPFLHGAEQIPG